MSKRLTTNEFIQKAKQIYGNRYDYSKVNYLTAKDKVCIICPEHGEFWQQPSNHLCGKEGCKKCRYIKSGNKKKNGIEWFILEARKIHGDKYDYSKSVYINKNSNTTIICPKHGKFEQRIDHHLEGCECPKCSREKLNKKRSSDTDEFIQKAKLKHINDNYDYSLVNYINNHTNVKIICPIHGIFEQTPANHLKGENCPYCNKSKGEILVRDFLIKNNINYVEQYKINIDKNINESGFAYLDFYIPKYNLIIEYNGEQHYKPMRFSGGILAFEHQQLRDNAVREYCKNNNIKLLEIEYKYNKKEDIDKILNDYFKNYEYN